MKQIKKFVSIVFLSFLLFGCSEDKVRETAVALWNLKFSDIVHFFQTRSKKLSKRNIKSKPQISIIPKLAHKSSEKKFSVFINSKPAGALVSYNGSNGYPVVLGLTPLKSKLKAEDYILKFQLSGYRERTITVNPIERQKINITLEKADDTLNTTLKKSKMILVDGGTYEMGDNIPMKEKGYQPRRKVFVSSFYISSFEVTCWEYDDYCKSKGLSLPKILFEEPPRANRPVANVSWNDAILYCNWRSLKEGLEPVYEFSKTSGNLEKVRWKANGYRLPTEAEWEYAARGGRFSHNTLYAGSADINKVAWYDKNSNMRTHPVGSLMPNELGLYDMTGNVSEWCYDTISYTPVLNSVVTNPGVFEKGKDRVERGGNIYLNSHYDRIPFRMSGSQDERSSSVGFRLVRSVK